MSRPNAAPAFTPGELATRAGEKTRDTLMRRAGRSAPSRSDRLAGAIVQDELLSALQRDLAAQPAEGQP